MDGGGKLLQGFCVIRDQVCFSMDIRLMSANRIRHIYVGYLMDMDRPSVCLAELLKEVETNESQIARCL
jgi:hypothetical protein